MAKILTQDRITEYSKNFKINVVRLSYLECIQSKQVADIFQLHPFMLSRWRKEYRDGLFVAQDTRKVSIEKQSKPPPKKARRLSEESLEKENARLKKENALLKKWQGYLKEVRANDSDSSIDTD